MTLKEKAKKWRKMEKATFEEFAREVLEVTADGIKPACYGEGAPYEWCQSCGYRLSC